MNRSACIATVIAVALAGESAAAGDSYVIRDEAGGTVYVVEELPIGTGYAVRRPDTGQLVATVKELGPLGGLTIHDADTGQEVGRVHPPRVSEPSTRDRRDWRDGPRQEWGSHSDRWGG